MHPKRPVDALLFDFGNVLVDIDFGRAFETWASAAGVAAELIAQRFSFDAAFDAYESGEIDDSGYFGALRETLGVALSEEQLRAGWNRIFVQPRAGMETLLSRLAPIVPLYLFSNTNAVHRQFWSVEYQHLLDPFSRLFCSHEVGMRKPSTAAFLHVVERMGVAPSRVAFFDDSAANIEGARAAGLIGFHITSMDTLRRALVDELQFVIAA